MSTVYNKKTDKSEKEESTEKVDDNKQISKTEKKKLKKK
jgi:hypothetical protein